MKKTSKKFDPLSLEKKILGNNFIRSLRIFKKFGKSFERGYSFDPMTADESTVHKISIHLSKSGLQEATVIKVINTVSVDLKKIFKSQRYVEKPRYNKNELHQIKTYAQKLKDIFLNKNYEKMFDAEKVLGEKTNDTWLDYLDKILEAVEYENKSLKKKSLVRDIEHAVCAVGKHLEQIDKRLKPTTYYYESQGRLGLGGELIYLCFRFYDKRINRRTIKDALKNYKQITKQVGRIGNYSY